MLITVKPFEFDILTTVVKGKLIWFLIGIILLSMALLIGFATLNDSPTSDEPPHILSGYAFVRFGHNFIDPEHPLLVKSLSAVPLLFADLKIDTKDHRYSQQRYEIDVGEMFSHSRDFLAYQGNNPDQILFLSRLPMIVLTALFGFVVFLLTKKLFGTLAAVLAVGFYATEPLFLAHGSLVNTDVAAAGFVITSVFALILYMEKQSRGRLVFLILALAAGLLSKFSTFYLFPLIVLILIFFYKSRGLKLYHHLGILSLGLLICISLFYGAVGFLDTGLLGFFPIRYFAGLFGSLIAISSNERFGYLLGESYFGSRIYYFPIMILAKTQLLTLLGAAIGIVLFLKKELRLNRFYLVAFFVPLITFFGLSLLAKFNIGVRHVMPVYPFLIILAGAGFAWASREVANFVPKNLKLSTILFVLLVIFSFRIYSVVSTYPHFLSYYNIVAGGTDNGWKVADDSNYDWGQDVKRLAEFVRENNIKSIAFDNYTGRYAAVDYYHIPATEMFPSKTDYTGYLALSTSVITYHEDKTDNYSWVVDNYQPIARAGKSIFIFKIK